MSNERSNTTTGGIGCAGIGSVIAILISWAAIHGFFGWFYVIYYLLTR